MKNKKLKPLRPRQRAVLWLTYLFKTRTFVPAEEMRELAHSAKISWRSLERAKSRAEIASVLRYVNGERRWYWTPDWNIYA